MGNIEKPQIFRAILMKTISTNILTIKKLEIGYSSGKSKKVLLPPLDAVAGEGELIAVIGRNGIGKSTLLRTIAGLQSGIGGSIFYNERNINEYTRIDLAREVGYISTEIVKVSNMRVYDLVALGRFPHTNWIGKIEPEDDEIILDAIEKTAMSSFRNKFVSELSDGERQKVMIARILAQDTGIMIMDEPTAFLDIGSKYEILHLLHELSRKSHKTIIFSTHDLQMAVCQADKIWMILDDRLVEGAPEDLIIKGAFEHLFDSSPVKFNTENGTFTFRGEERGSYYIEGNGIIHHWTEEAVKRSGFGISDLKTYPYIKTPSGTTLKWKLIDKPGENDFNSIYDLILHLTSLNRYSN
jgi:iron complex transport system ATP-binding protein